MLNRNAARHLLLVASILLCAFIYAGYSLATRGGAEPAEDPAAAAETTTVSGLRPASGDDAARLIPPANGEELSLTPPAAQSMRPPPSPPPAAVSGSISGLIPDTSGGEDASASGLMPGTSLPLPGFSSSAPADAAGDEASSPPVLTLPGMTSGDAFADADGSSGDEDFGDGDFGDGDGDFAALPGFDAPVEPAAAPVLPPPPGSGFTPPAATPVASLRGPAAETAGTVLRPPPQSAPPPAPPPAAVRPVVAPPPAPAPTRTPPPPPPGANPLDGMAAEGDDPGPRSDSLRIYVVRPGDTLSSIAMRELGSGFLADNIFLLNRDVIGDPNQLMAGVKIRLPYANPADGGVDTGPAVPGGASARRPTQGLGGTHTVARGDTLSSIAQQYYGRSDAWSFLHEANKAVIPDPNRLSVGMELSVPPYGE